MFLSVPLPARRNLRAIAGVTAVAALVIVVAFAPVFAPYDPNAIAITKRLQGPSAAHWLGTDQLGRDLLSRVIYGGRIALGIAAGAIGVALVLGTAIGILAAYASQRIDNLILLVLDAIRSFPTMILALAAIALTGPSMTMVTVIIVVVSIPQFARLARTSTQAVLNREFILAERSLGAPDRVIILRHILPNITGPLIVLASMEVPTVVSIEAGLSFLGLGILPPTPSWGAIMNEGYLVIRSSPWPVIAGGVPLVIVTLGFTFLGEALRDALDPRLGRRR